MKRSNLVKSILIVGMFTMLLALGTAYAQNRSHDVSDSPVRMAPYPLSGGCAGGDLAALEICRDQVEK